MDKTPTTNGPTHVRGQGGKFLPGTCGGPGRTRHKSALADIRRAFGESWKVCDGPKLIRDLAKNKPLEYLKLMVSLLPKEMHIDAEARSVQIILYPEKPPEEGELQLAARGTGVMSIGPNPPPEESNT